MGFGSFLAGAANAGSADIEKRRDSALEIKMRSALLQQESDNRLKEMQQKDNLERFGPEASASIGKLGDYQAQPGERFTPSQASIFQGYGKAKIKSISRPSGMTAQQVGDGPDKKIVWFDKNNPGVISGELRVGQDPAAYRQYAKTAAEYAPVKVTVDNLNASIDELLNDDNLIQRGINSGKLSMGALFKEGNPHVIDLINNRHGYALQIAAVVNRGRPSDPDAKAIEEMLPSVNDSAIYAKTKMERIDKMLSSTEDSDYKMLMTGAIPQFRKDKNAEDSNSFSADKFKAWRAGKLAKEQADKDYKKAK